MATTATQPLTPLQITTIKSTIPFLQTHGNAITTHFYHSLLAAHPDLRSTFNLANQANNHQPLALASALAAYATHIDDVGALSPAVEKICQKHASLFVRPEQYEVVGKFLLEAMAEVLGEACTPEVLAAWAAAYWQLARLMIGREEELYAAAGEECSGWRDFRIVRKERESEEITSFYLEPLGGREVKDFLPGQYISVRVEVPELGCMQPRQYSLSDAPNGRYYRISVKNEPGLDPTKPEDARHPGCVSNILHDEKKVGNALQVSHPYGEFFLRPEQAEHGPTVLLSAGVGLTPMVSMVNTLTSRGVEQPVSFIHGARTASSRAFHTHLSSIAAQHSNVQYTTFVKNPKTVLNGESTDCTFRGRLNLDQLDADSDLFLHNKSSQYFVCGPETFMKDTEAGLLRRGVSQDNIHMEVFGAGPVLKG